MKSTNNISLDLIIKKELEFNLNQFGLNCNNTMIEICDAYLSFDAFEISKKTEYLVLFSKDVESNNYELVEIAG